MSLLQDVLYHDQIATARCSRYRDFIEINPCLNTGLCSGFVVTVASCVEKAEGDRCTVPPIEWIPSPGMREMQRQFPLSILSETRAGESLEGITRENGRFELLERITSTFIQRIADRAGCVVDERLPALPLREKGSFIPLKKAQGFIAETFRKHPRSLVFTLSGEKEHIAGWHNLYVNPKLGIIADGGNLLFYRVSKVTHREFAGLFFQFICSKYSERYEDCCFYACHLDLSRKRALSFCQKVSGFALETMHKLKHIPRHPSLFLSSFSRGEKEKVVGDYGAFFEHLKKVLMGPKGIEGAVEWASLNGNLLKEISKRDVYQGLRIHFFPGLDLSKKMREEFFLRFVSSLTEMGEEVQLFNFHLQKYLLSLSVEALDQCASFSKKKKPLRRLTRVFIPQMLKARRKFETPFSLKSCLEQFAYIFPRIEGFCFCEINPKKLPSCEEREEYFRLALEAFDLLLQEEGGPCDCPELPERSLFFMLCENAAPLEALELVMKKIPISPSIFRIKRLFS